MARQPVYSTLFYEGYGEPVSGEYTVPDGYLAVVRDIVGLSEGDPDIILQVAVNPADSTIAYLEFGSADVGFVHWEGRQVVNPGSTIAIDASGTTFVSARVSGYLLGLP